jgi:hypothetical protein
VPLHQLDDGGLAPVVATITALVNRPGFGCALATKVLHEKGPAAIPVVDNQAIFATHPNDAWRPGRPRPSRSISVRSSRAIAAALEAVAGDLSHATNQPAWDDVEAHPRGMTE